MHHVFQVLGHLAHSLLDSLEYVNVFLETGSQARHSTSNALSEVPNEGGRMMPLKLLTAFLVIELRIQLTLLLNHIQLDVHKLFKALVFS